MKKNAKTTLDIIENTSSQLPETIDEKDQQK